MSYHYYVCEVAQTETLNVDEWESWVQVDNFQDDWIAYELRDEMSEISPHKAYVVVETRANGLWAFCEDCNPSEVEFNG